MGCGCRVLRFWDLCETESPQAPLACGVMVYPTQALCACHKPLWRATAAFPQAHKMGFWRDTKSHNFIHHMPHPTVLKKQSEPVTLHENGLVTPRWLWILTLAPPPYLFTLPLPLPFTLPFHLHLHLHHNLPLRRLPAPNPPPSRVAVHLALRIASTPNSSQYNYSYH